MRRSWIMGCAAMLSMVGCQGAGEDPEVSARSQAVQTQPLSPEFMARVQEFLPTWSSVDERPPEQGPPMQVPPRDHITCPREKHQRTDWAPLFSQKQAAKQSEYTQFATRPPVMLSAVGAVSSERIARQQEFLDAVKARQAEFDAMPQIEREQAYAELEDSILQPGSGVQLDADTPSAGIEHGIEVPVLSKSFWVLDPNTSYTFETVNLTPNGNTVINIQDYYTGAFVDGNDNCGTRLAGCSGYRSYLTIAPSTSTRYVWVIVRSYWPGTAWDSATLRVTKGSNPPEDFPVDFTGGYHKRLTSFALNSHFLTTREPDDTVDDTVMLVTSNNAGYGMAFDDDSGTAWMSDIDTPQACSPNCYVIIGAYSHGTTTFIWDEDAHDASKNSDTDGLSDTLEGVIGTNSYFSDSDADGINDYEELIGVDVWPDLLNFPWYGANPLKPDLFVEADWKECVRTEPGECGNDPEGSPHISN